MWCKGCQRGQKPDETGRCPECRKPLGEPKEEKKAKEVKMVEDFYCEPPDVKEVYARARKNNR